MPARPLRIGVDAWNLLADRRGIGRYVRAMLREWSSLFRDDIDVTLLVPEWPAVFHTAKYRREAGVNVRVRSRSAARSPAIDVLWFPWNGLSWSARKPKVAVLHDASLFALEIPSDERERELRPFRRAAAESAHIITDSRFSKGELIKYLAVDPASIDVVPLGVDTAREKDVARPDLPFEFPYLLFVGEFEKRKGIDVLIDALARLPLQLRTTHGLVLAGAARGTAQLQSELPTAILGHVSDSVLSALYRNAAAFVYPSRYEGFGLPVLEAMAHGTPVIASDAGAIPETGGDAARYFRSGDAADLAAALTEVLQSIGLAQQMRDRGLQRAAQMPWSATAKKTFEIIRREPDAGSRPRA